MESSKEKIEAQLCAYVDGQLTDGERADIERHLAANPHHKALIADLRQMSGLLRDLPRAKAPHELNEAICGPLERSSLLSPSEEETREAVLSINRWPQVAAVAAVLLLALGLGVVVYYVLPASTPPRGGQVALDTKDLPVPTDGAPADRAGGFKSPAVPLPPQGPSREVAKAKGVADVNATLNAGRGRGHVRDVDDDDGETERPADAGPRPRTSDAEANVGRQFGGGRRGAGAGPGAGTVDKRASWDEAERSGIAGAPDPRGVAGAKEVAEYRSHLDGTLGRERGVYLVVSTADTRAAAGRIGGYLKGKGIPFETRDEDGLADALHASGERVALRKSAAGADRILGDKDRVAAAAAAPARPLAGTESASGLAAGGGPADGRGVDGDDKLRPDFKPGAAAVAKKTFEDGVKPAATADELSKTADASSKSKGGWSADAPAPPGDAPADLAKRLGPDEPLHHTEGLQNPGGVNVQGVYGKSAKNEAESKQAKPASLGIADNAPAAISRGVSDPTAAAGGATFEAQRATGAGSQAAVKDAEALNIRPVTADAAVDRLKTDSVVRPAGTVFFARMNRRQAGELKAALSQEPGQSAELKSLADVSRDPVAGNRYARIGLGNSAAENSVRQADAAAGRTLRAADVAVSPPAAPAPAAPAPAKPGVRSAPREEAAPSKPNARATGGAATSLAAGQPTPATRPAIDVVGAPQAAGPASPPRPNVASVLAEAEPQSPAAADEQSDYFRTRPDLLDEPVDVVIVLNESAGASGLRLTPAAAGGKDDSKLDKKK